MRVEILQKQISLARRFGFVYLCFDPLRCYSLTSIDTFNCIGGPACVRACVRACVCVYPKTNIYHKFCILFVRMLNHLLYLTYENICDRLQGKRG